MRRVRSEYQRVPHNQTNPRSTPLLLQMMYVARESISSSGGRRWQCVARQSVVTATEVALCIRHRKRAPRRPNSNTLHPHHPPTPRAFFWKKVYDVARRYFVLLARICIGLLDVGRKYPIVFVGSGLWAELREASRTGINLYRCCWLRECATGSGAEH